MKRSHRPHTANRRTLFHAAVMLVAVVPVIAQAGLPTHKKWSKPSRLVTLR